MFNAGRILRNLNKRDSIAPRSTFASTSKAKKKKPKRKFRCYVPFVWQAMAAACAGVVVVAAGAGLCVVGYYADRMRNSLPRRLDNVTSAWMEGEETRQQLCGFCRWKVLIYVGPALMSCGSFAIVFSCVVVCEMRDKLLEIMDEREEVGLDPNVQHLKLDFFQSVVFPQHNRTRPQEQVHSSAPGGGQLPSGAVAEVSQTQQPRATTNKEQRDNCTEFNADLCRRLFVDVSDASAVVGGSSERLPGLLLTNSGDEDDSCTGRTKRVRYSSDPTSVHWATAALHWRGTSAPLPTTVARTQGRCTENARQLVVTRVANVGGQRLSCKRTANVRRLLVTREPAAGGRKTGYQTNSIEVLFNSTEVVPELVSTCEGKGSTNRRATAHGAPKKDRSFSCSTPPTNSASSTAPSGNDFAELRRQANVLVHQAYVHADPEKGHPITTLLPPNIQLPQFTPDKALPVMSARASSIASLPDRRVLPIKTPFSVSSVSFRSPSSLGTTYAASQLSRAHVSTPKRSSPQSPNIEKPSHLHSRPIHARQSTGICD